MYTRLIAVASIAIAFSAPLEAQGARWRCYSGGIGAYENNPDKLIRDCTDSLRRWKGPRDYTYRGYGHMANRDYDKAEKDFRRGMSAPGKNRYMAYEGMGRLYLDRYRKADKALPYYEESVRRRPDNHSALIGRAEAYWRSGNREAAKRAYEDILNKPYRPEVKKDFYYDREYHLDAWAREIARREYRKLKGY